jgi:hypothetical protein
VSKYDFNSVPHKSLTRLAEVCIGNRNGTHNHDSYMRAMADVESAATVKTRSDYDREIGDWLRKNIPHDEFHLQGRNWHSSMFFRLEDLINASRTAIE